MQFDDLSVDEKLFALVLMASLVSGMLDEHGNTHCEKCLIRDDCDLDQAKEYRKNIINKERSN